MEDKVLSFIQISDLHITDYRNLLEPMVDKLNEEKVDFIVVTGDLADSSDKETIDLAANTVEKLKHKVIVIPGDYDNGKFWVERFGDRYKHMDLKDYHFEFMDTSFVRHRFGVGWADVIKDEDPEQYEWLVDRLNNNKGYHVLFSHHPFWTRIKQEEHELLTNNLRAVYSGHVHELSKFYFEYRQPLKHFSKGFCNVPMTFHGNACYMIVFVNKQDELLHVPRVIGAKISAW